MKKTDFYKLLGQRDYIDMCVFEQWAHWRTNQGLDYDIADWDLQWEQDWQTKEIVVKSPHEIVRFPETDFYEEVNREDEPQMLWHLGYWDGPRSGIARYKGKIVYFSIVSEDWFSRVRTFNLYELSDKEVEREIRSHNQWRNQGMTHCDYCDDFMDPTVEPDKEPETLLEKLQHWLKRKMRRSYTKNKVVGTFDYCQFWKERNRVYLSQKVDSDD